MARESDSPPLEVKSVNDPAMVVDADESTSPLMPNAAVARRLSDAQNIGAQKNQNQQTDDGYDIHKAIAKSAMDISLLTANANQLRLLIHYNYQSKTYIACITLVIASLVLQMLVTCGLIITKMQPKSKRRSPRLHGLKIATTIGVAIITVINILVASLVVTDGPGPAPAPAPAPAPTPSGGY